jgi:hypothetical protein
MQMDSKKWSMWAQITIVLGIVMMVASQGGLGLSLLGVVFLIGGIVALIYGKVRGRERTA